MDCFTDLKSKDITNITMSDVEYILDFPKTIGNYKDGNILLKYGQHGVYFVYNGKNYSIKGDISTISKFKVIIDEISLDKCIELINTGYKSKSDIFKQLGDITVKTGQFGPYIQKGKRNVSIPKNIKPEDITIEQCNALLKQKK